MAKTLLVKGIRIDADAIVKAPTKRFGLKCYDKAVCEVQHCAKYDKVVTEMVATVFGYKPTKTICRQVCGEDCKRRINFSDVTVEVCKDCEYLSVQEGNRLMHIPPAVNCLKYIEESRGKHKPTRYSRERRIYRRGVAGGWHYRDVP